MRRSQKSKRVTWASDVNLCQVRQFLSEDSPSQVGSSRTQEHLQEKVSWAEQQQSGVGFDDNLPPGFEGIIQPCNLWRVNLSQIPLINWKFPPRFVVNSDWRVVAGEESSETEAQNQRELRVLEAIYPRPSAIPPNPTAPADDSVHSDQNTPIVPITPIEDEDSAPDGATSANSTPMTPQPGQTFSPDIAAAAKAALSAITSNKNDSSNLIDRDLLVKILSDPKMVEQLVKNRNTSSTMPNTPLMHNVPPPPRPAISMNNTLYASTQYNIPHVGPMPKSSFDPVNVPRPKTVNPSISATASPFYPQSSTIRPFTNVRPPLPDVISPPSSPLPVPVKKDINYYKSLIQQHGAEKRENLPQFGTSQEQMSKSLIQQHGVERRDVLPQFGHQSSQQMGTSQEVLNFTQVKPKIMKPCIYLNTSRGCRNGANCLYQHEGSSQQRVSGGILDVQTAKRVKLDREITGS